MNSPLKIAVTLPYLFSIRDFLFTPVWEQMARRTNVHFCLLCAEPQAIQLGKMRAVPNIAIIPFPPASVGQSEMNISWVNHLKKMDREVVNPSLIYRFAAVNNLSHYHLRRNKTLEGQQRSQIIFEYRLGEAAGLPHPNSLDMFQKLYEFHHLLPGISYQESDLRFLADLKPDIFVFGRLHFYPTAYWAALLRRLGIPMVGIVSSWDHPTTKEPTPRGMSGYVVASARMVDEMSELHGIDPAKIVQVGKVQMDVYRDETIFVSRDVFLQQLKIPADHRLVVMGTNTTGLKEHEVSIAKKLADNFVAGRYGKATLLLRTHPQDINWERDFLALSNPPNVICLDAASFGNRNQDKFSKGRNDLIFLANLMKHADVVIQSRGSLALDAIAFDTPVISLAFDGDLNRTPQDSFLLEYNYEHYKPLVAAQGTWVVGSYKVLDHAIQQYLNNPTIHAQGRKRIRREHIDPLDGNASKRLVDYLVESAQKARAGTLSAGDWHLTGLGDLQWASRQTTDVRDYVQCQIAGTRKMVTSNTRQIVADDNSDITSERSIRVLSMALEAPPHNLKNLLNLAQTHYNTGHYEAALNCFKEVIEREPQNADAWLGIAAIAKTLDDQQTFSAAYHHARRLAPTHPGVKELGTP